MKPDDLISKLGAKKVDGSSPATTTVEGSMPNTPIGTGAPSDGLDRGTNLIDSATNVTQSQPTETKVETKADTVSDVSTWTLESALKEVKKLREENKITRVKYQEQVNVIKAELDKKAESIKNEYQEALQAKQELEALKAHEADKKRDLAEKLAHRESKIAQLEAERNHIASESSKELQLMKERLAQLEAERQAQLQSYTNRLGEELNKIPEQFREFAQKMVQGYGDPREALMALAEASMKGLFEEKKVIVNHSVPGANTGARASKDKMDAAAAEARKNMSSAEMIKQGLQGIRKGEPNSAFRGK